MSALDIIRALGPIDLRNIRRDKMLAWIVVMAGTMALLIRFLVPWLRDEIVARFGFDIEPYYPVIMSYFFLMLGGTMVGIVLGFLLLDEKDDRTLQALQVTPLSIQGYLTYRVVIPTIVAFLFLMVFYPLAGLGNLGFWQLAVVAIAAAPMAPLWMLFLGTFATNKVQGFALMKVSGFILLFVPIIAYFVQPPWHWLFGLIPTFWPMKVYWMLEAGESPQWAVLLVLLVALAYQGLLLVWLLRRFVRTVYD